MALRASHDPPTVPRTMVPPLPTDYLGCLVRRLMIETVGTLRSVFEPVLRAVPTLGLRLLRPAECCGTTR